MARTVLSRFNRGEVDRRAQERLEVDKIRDACSLMENFLPKRLGTMAYRSGTKYKGLAPFDDNLLIPFIAATDDTALVILGADGHMTVWVDGARLRNPEGRLTLTNSTFASNLSGWNEVETSGANCVHTADNGGSASLYSYGEGVAAIWQTFGGSGFANEHSITVEIEGADMYIEIGSTAAAHSKDFFSGKLGAGIHCIRFVATSQPTITFSSISRTPSRVVGITLNNSDLLDISLGNGLTDLSTVQVEQSGDVLFLGSSETKPFKIERRENNSWSIVKYQPADGEFGLVNDSPTTMLINSLEGSSTGEYLTLTASKDHFTSSSVGNLYKLVSNGQKRQLTAVTGTNTYTEAILISGDAAFRTVTYFVDEISGAANVVLQKSKDLLGWDNAIAAITADTGVLTLVDASNGEDVYYRIGTSSTHAGSATFYVSSPFGSIEGIARVVSVTSATAAEVEVIQRVGSVSATFNWYAGVWNEGRYPNAPRIHEGRLFWGGRNGIRGSITDQYESFNDAEEGAAAPISKTIGFGAVDVVEWLMVCSRLIIGLASDEVSVRSNAYGDPLTQSNANLKSGSTYGAASVPPVKIDNSIVFVQRSGKKLIKSEYVGNSDSQDHEDLMLLHENICTGGITRMAVTRQPETRIYAVLASGEMRVLMLDSVEEVNAWSRITMDGTILDVAVLPKTDEDEIYILIERDGVQMVEIMDAIGDMVDNHFDSSLAYTSPTTVITGLDHLEGKTVGVWADSQDRGTYTVATGSITVPAAYTDVVVGLPYVADYKSGKIYDGDEMLIGERKRILDYTLCVLNLWPRAIKVGYSFDVLDNMPLNEDGATLSLTAMIDEYNGTPIPFNGSSEIDPRICIRATAPCEILAMSYTTNGKKAESN